MRSASSLKSTTHLYSSTSSYFPLFLLTSTLLPQLRFLTLHFPLVYCPRIVSPPSCPSPSPIDSLPPSRSPSVMPFVPSSETPPTPAHPLSYLSFLAFSLTSPPHLHSPHLNHLFTALILSLSSLILTTFPHHHEQHLHHHTLSSSLAFTTPYIVGNYWPTFF